MKMSLFLLNDVVCNIPVCVVAKMVKERQLRGLRSAVAGNVQDRTTKKTFFYLLNCFARQTNMPSQQRVCIELHKNKDVQVFLLDYLCSFNQTQKLLIPVHLKVLEEAPPTKKHVTLGIIRSTYQMNQRFNNLRLQ